MVTLELHKMGESVYVVEYDSAMAEVYGSGHTHHGPFANEFTAHVWIDSQVTHGAAIEVTTGHSVDAASLL